MARPHLVKHDLISTAVGVQLQELRRIGHRREKECAAQVLALMEQSSYSEIKAKCAWVLGRLRHGDAYECLVSNLKSPNAKARIWSAWALGELGLYRAQVVLTKALAIESDGLVRRAIGGALKTLNYDSTRVHRSVVMRALKPPWSDDPAIMGMVAQLEKLNWPGDSEEIVAIRSRIKDRDSNYLVEYMKWVRWKPELITMADDKKRVFR